MGRNARITKRTGRRAAIRARHHLRHRARGLTLVEMLCVTAIIAVLASIMLPVLGTAERRANQTQCLSNVRQIGVAFAAYLGDWDNRYPAAWNEWHTPAYADSGPYLMQEPGIVETLSPYGATAPLWRCPADTGLNLRFSDYWMGGRNRPFWKDGGASYYYRDMQDLTLAPAYPDPRNASLATRPAGVVKRPNSFVLLTDVLPWHTPPAAGQSYWTFEGLTVALYCDGHAGTQPWNDVRENIDTPPGM